MWMYAKARVSMPTKYMELFHFLTVVVRSLGERLLLRDFNSPEMDWVYKTARKKLLDMNYGAHAHKRDDST